MVFDAHDKAFAFFGGACARGIYDSEALFAIGPRTMVECWKAGAAVMRRQTSTRNCATERSGKCSKRSAQALFPMSDRSITARQAIAKQSAERGIPCSVPASVSKTCLIRFDKNRYSVDAHAVGRPVEIRAYADRLECWQDGQIVGQHERVFGRDKTIFEGSVADRGGILRSHERF